MKKKALKKLIPNRHKILLALRKENNIKQIVTRRGHLVCLNPMKRMMFNKPYVNEEYKKEVARYMKQNMKQEGVENA